MKPSDEERKLFEELEQAGELTAERVALDAADPSHPSHERIYGQSDGEAAWQHRVSLARQLIGAFRVEVVGGGERTVEARQFVHVPSERRYVDGDQAFKNFRDELHVQAQKGIRLWVLRHRRFSNEELLAIVQTELTNT